MSDAPAVDPAVGLGQIEASDPAFNLELFKGQAVDTFLEVKLAIQDRDVTRVEDTVTDSVYEQLRDTVSGLLARGAIQHYDGLSPSEIAVVAADHGPQGDAITLRIKAAGMQYMGSEDTDRDVGPGMYGSFTEFWTFSRPQGAGTTVQRPECPTCGAPIGIDTGRICRYCKTLMPAPRAQSGWVVAAVRPAQENLA